MAMRIAIADLTIFMLCAGGRLLFLISEIGRNSFNL